MLKPLLLAAALAALLAGHPALAQSAPPAPPADAALQLRAAPAWQAPGAQNTPLLAATRAGQRLVAVGARGAVFLSDDQGRSWRQSQGVPVGSTLTSVSFVDAKKGWAAGHNGVILASDDGGETWRRQRWSAQGDQPLFGIRFSDADNGIAVGLWSLVLQTRNGGLSWEAVALPKPPAGAKKDLNFFQVFGDQQQLYIAAEAGWLLRSPDGGAHWSYQNVGSKASLWAGAAQGREVWVGGLLGKTFYSRDAGATWQALDAGMKASVTAIRVEQQRLVLAGLDGNVSVSSDGGQTFAHSQRPDRLALSDVLARPDGNWLYFSGLGPVAP